MDEEDRRPMRSDPRRPKHPRALCFELGPGSVDVRNLEPHHVTPIEIDTAARVITIGCSLSDPEGPAFISDRWDDVPPASDDLDASVAAIRRHVEELAEELDGHR